MIPYFLEDPLRELWPESSLYRFQADEAGIVTLTYLRRLRQSTFGCVVNQYHPTAIAANALSHFNRFLSTADYDNRREFLTHADWLVANLKKRGPLEAWEYHVRWNSPGYRAEPPFVSSMGQGMGISVLLRARQMTGDPTYSHAAERALTPFIVPVAAGGLLYAPGTNDSWYEGIPSPAHVQVLNEVCFGLVGLYELHSLEGNATAGELFRRGSETVRRHLPDFDLNLPLFKWSKYDTKWYFYSGDKYHRVHVKQLKWLADATGDRLFAEYHLRWAGWQEKYGGRNSLGRQLFLVFWRLYVAFLMLCNNLYVEPNNEGRRACHGGYV